MEHLRIAESTIKSYIGIEKRNGLAEIGRRLICGTRSLLRTEAKESNLSRPPTGASVGKLAKGVASSGQHCTLVWRQYRCFISFLALHSARHFGSKEPSSRNLGQRCENHSAQRVSLILTISDARLDPD